MEQLYPRGGDALLQSTRRQRQWSPTAHADMFPDDVRNLAPREHRRAMARSTTEPSSGTRGDEQSPSADRDGRLAVVAAGGQRGTLYDSFELNAMVARLNRVLNGEEARRPRRMAGSWFAAPKVLFRKIKCAFLGARRGGI